LLITSRTPGKSSVLATYCCQILAGLEEEWCGDRRKSARKPAQKPTANGLVEKSGRQITLDRAVQILELSLY